MDKTKEERINEIVGRVLLAVFDEDGALDAAIARIDADEHIPDSFRVEVYDRCRKVLLEWVKRLAMKLPEGRPLPSERSEAHDS